MNNSPSVLFVCSSNKGKSRMAEALAARYVALGHCDGQSIDAVEVHSAGTHPAADGHNAQSAAAIAEVGADITNGFPKSINPDLLRSVSRVIVIGSAAELTMPSDAAGTVERWLTVEPSDNGIEGMERMRLIRDDIDTRVRQLLIDLAGKSSKFSGE